MGALDVRVSPKIYVRSTQENRYRPPSFSINIDLIDQIELSQGIVYTCTYCEGEAAFRNATQLQHPCAQCLAHLHKRNGTLAI